MIDHANTENRPSVSWWAPVLFAAMAGGMGWGIRGQYGHETGAMIAGLLVSLTLTALLCPDANPVAIARAVALCTVAMGFGGSQTYGQTLGLTHDPLFIGNWEAWRWGMLGALIKGGLWIGFAGVFLGIGLSETRYRWRELFLLMIVAVVVHRLGVYLLNEPFDPVRRALPRIYFSESWYWKPTGPVKPRREVWGGLLFALVVVLLYVRLRRKDTLAWRLGLWGVLGGAVGFPLGQCIQSYHQWNIAAFHTGFWAQLDPDINWWNMMETTFGATMGAILGLGLWLNRKRIRPPDPGLDTMPAAAEIALMADYIVVLVGAEFLGFWELPAVYGVGILLGILPMVASVNGRWAPILTLLPVTLLPIAGKTVQELVYDHPAIGHVAGWTLYLIVPLAISIAVAVWLAKRVPQMTGAAFLRPALALSAWTYFLLNFAYFRYPWPWAHWTRRTPNGIIFTICLIGLTFVALRIRPTRPAPDTRD